MILEIINSGLHKYEKIFCFYSFFFVLPSSKPNLVFSEDKQLVGVFGASGRTGTHIIDELIRRDVNIRAFSRRTKENADTDSLNWVVADVTNKESLAEALKNVDVIISAIGPVDGDNSENVD